MRTSAPPSEESPAAEEVDSPIEPPEVEPAEVEPPEVEPVVEPVAEKSTRRGKFLRRRKNGPLAETDSDTAKSTDAATDGDEAEAAESEVSEGDATEAAESEVTEGDVIEGDAAEETILVPHRPAGKRLKIAAAAAAVLFVAGGAFVGATAQPVIANRAQVETKLDIARTAANAITTLWSYTPDNMDSLAQRSARYLTGDFAFQYRKFIDSIVATNKQAQVTNTTSVLGTAVESLSQSEASAIVYTNSVATSPVSKNIPSLRYLSYRLEMKRDRSDWRITRMTTITTLDLTPQL